MGVGRINDEDSELTSVEYVHDAGCRQHCSVMSHVYSISICIGSPASVVTRTMFSDFGGFFVFLQTHTTNGASSSSSRMNVALLLSGSLLYFSLAVDVFVMRRISTVLELQDNILYSRRMIPFTSVLMKGAPSKTMATKFRTALKMTRMRVSSIRSSESML